MRIMTVRIAAMTGFAFTIGVLVGVLFHLPGTTSPSTYRTGIAREKHGPSRTLHAWRERLSSPENEQDFLPGEPYSANTDRRGAGEGFRRSAEIAEIVPRPDRIALLREDKVNRHYNDRAFIHSRNKPQINISELSESAVRAYRNRHIEPVLFKIDDITTVEQDGKGRSELIRSRILSVLNDIKEVKIEQSNILNDITQGRIRSGLGGINENSGHLGRVQVSQLPSVESQMSEDDSANISDVKSDKGTPIANKASENNYSSQNGLGNGPGGARPTYHQTAESGHLSRNSADKNVDIVNGIFWSEELENLCPRGFQERLYTAWRERIRRVNVVGVAEGCGRMQNRRLTFQDNSTACARYRPNIDQIQGEVYSYYLSRLLNINNVPPSVLLPVQSADEVWTNVEREIAMSQWGDDKLIVLTKWIDGLEPAYIPTELRGDTKRLYPSDVQLGNRSVSELCELAQWSDLIVFDYLTANLDRVVNNMFNQQWNSQMMSYPAHNLHKIKHTNTLVFLDNESGLFHGYRLLDKYSKYHEEMLSSLCVFRKQTVKQIEKLFLDDTLESDLHETLKSNEPQAKNFPQMPDKNMHILKQRLQNVFEQIQKCQRQVSR